MPSEVSATIVLGSTGCRPALLPADAVGETQGARLDFFFAICVAFFVASDDDSRQLFRTFLTLS